MVGAAAAAPLVTVAVALAVVGVGVGIVVTRTGSGSPSAPKTTTTAPATTLLTQSGLEELARTLGRPLFWVGPQPGADYELTSSPDGRLFLRYLPAGSKAGAQGNYLSVGTYPFANAYAATVRAAGRQGFAQLNAGPGAAAVYAQGRPTNVFLAFQNLNYQIELFHPQAAEARRLVVERHVVPVAPQPGG